MSKSRASRPTEDPTSKGPKVQFNEAELPGNNKNEHFERKKSPAKTPSPSRKGHGRKKSRSPSSKRKGARKLVLPSKFGKEEPRKKGLNMFQTLAQKISKGAISRQVARRPSGYQSDTSSSDDSSSEDENFTDSKTLLSQPELPPEFWQVQKLVRYLKVGNQTGTILALCNLVDFNLKKEHVQIAILDAGGLEVLTNLLDTDDFKCKIGSLRVLREVSIHPDIRRAITMMGGIEVTVSILNEPDGQVQLVACEMLANLAKFRKARRAVRRCQGIPKLINLLDIDTEKYSELENCSDDDLPLPVRVARSAAFALWPLSKSAKNKECIKQAEGLSLLARLVRMKEISVIIPAIGTLQECATDKAYCLQMQSEGLVEFLVHHLQTSSPKLKMLCANAIFRLAEEQESRQLVKMHGGLEPLVDLINDANNAENKQLLAAVTGAIWKVSADENVDRLVEMGLVPTLTRLLIENSDALDDLQFNPLKINVLTNVVGAIAESAKYQTNRELIKKEDGLAPLIKLIATNHPDLLVNVSAALGQCAKDKTALKRIHELDGVRLLWSLLKHPSERVQASAAWAVSPCIQNASNSGDMVRSFVGGLELICGLLESMDTEVLAAVCYAIANIANDKENLAVITDHGVIEKLSKLANTDNDVLRAKLAMAIGNCCEWSGNRAAFGKAGAVAPLVSYLTSEDLEVHRTTSVALYQLSKDPWNCVTMHQHGVVSHLLRLIGSEDEAVQEAAADCLQNIRKLALACEKFRYQHMKS